MAIICAFILSFLNYVCVYRAFSCDVMRSSNMAASIATAINIHLCKHYSAQWFLHGLFHSWFKRMMIVCTHGARDCPGYPGQSVQSDGHVGGQHNVSENALYFSFREMYWHYM